MSKHITLGFIVPSLGPGGAERVVARLAQALSDTFRCIIFIRRNAARHYQPDGVQVVETNFGLDPLRAALTDAGVTVVMDHFHWEEEHLRVLGQLSDEGWPVILTEHNAYHYPLFQACRDGKPKAATWFSDRYAIYAKFAAVTVLNEDARHFFGQHLENVIAIPNPVPAADPGAGPRAGQSVLNVSHFRKTAKRLDLLYRGFAVAARSCPDSVLTVVGPYDWAVDRYLRKQSGLADHQLYCVGQTRDVDRHYNDAAVFALSSDIEGQPMVLLEAAAHGVPQVAFDLPGLSDQVIDGETGYLVPFGDVDAFGGAIARLLNDPAHQATMGQAARALAQDRFSIDRILPIWTDLVTRVVADGQIARPVADPRPDTKALEHRWTDYWTGGYAAPQFRQPPKVSFLVPVYGTEPLLARCLSSIRAQSLEDFECIVVDDASPGDVEAAMKDGIGDDPRFTLIRHAENRGLYQARSTAAEAAQGQYLAHVDSDDYIHWRFAEYMYTEAIITGAEIVACGAVELTETGRPIRFGGAPRHGPVDGAEAARAFFNGSIRNVVWNKLYARDLWARTPDHNAFDIGLSVTEDTLRNTYLFCECNRFSSIRDRLYYYCRRGKSVVKGGDLPRLYGKLRDIEASYDRAVARARLRMGDGVAELLEERRRRDIKWYIEEFLERHDLTTVMAAARAAGPMPVDTVAMTLWMTQANADQARALNKLRRDRHWEQRRAKALSDRIDRAKTLLTR